MGSTKRNVFVDQTYQPFILGKLLGTGGSSRVFQLGNLSHVCIKICCGGSYVLGEGGCKCESLFQHSSYRSPCKKLDEIVLDSDEAVLQAFYIWASQTSEVAMRLCREHLNGMLRDEFELLKESNKASSPYKSKLFPRVFAVGMEANRTFIVMERVEGITLRKFISSSFVRKPVVENSYLQIDLLPEILEIIEALLQLSREIKFWHGDLKPENMSRGVATIA